MVAQSRRSTRPRAELAPRESARSKIAIGVIGVIGGLPRSGGTREEPLDVRLQRLFSHLTRVVEADDAGAVHEDERWGGADTVAAMS